ncbi:MAG: hypothetical protein EAY69_09960 [Cytophagales bacterium]|nr:MAG: hypothetical protein EAY69_09960 [Cytophagales bacterium]
MKKEQKKDKETKQYDNIFKENIEPVFLALCENYLQIDIEKTEEINDKLQTTIEREPDFLKIVHSKKREKFILHIEFQSKDESDMIYRMQEYYAILKKKYQIPIEQIVIYLDKNPSKMQTQLPENEIFNGFQLLSLHEIGYKNFIDSEIPEEVILAILCNFEEEKVEKVLEKIILTLKKISKDEITLQKYVRQILILSRLRNFTNIFHEIIQNNMPITLDIDIENDVLYKRGEIKGKTENSRQVAIKAIKKGFDDETINELTGLSVAEIKQIRTEL